MAALSGFFGMLAAVLAAVGLYGVISYRVIRRRNEIGIRMALGAGRRDVLNLIAKELGVLLLGGLLIGLALSIAGGRAAASLLYGLRPYEPSILAFAAALMCVVAIAATLIPSVRACRLDPMTALREE
jgi:ABC-type antimicrobial peptide transport system permease subunit